MKYFAALSLIASFSSTIVLAYPSFLLSDTPDSDDVTIVNAPGLNNHRLREERYDKCDDKHPCTDAPFYECKSDGYCYHKNVFPILGMEWVGYFTVTILMALCNVAGIGGGAIDQPIMQIFYKFQIKESIAISSMVILMAAIGRYIYTMSQRHPEKEHTVVVDYSLATVMVSTTLAGSQLGSKIFLKSFPPLIIQCLLEILLVFLAIQSFFKAR